MKDMQSLHSVVKHSAEAEKDMRRAARFKYDVDKLRVKNSKEYMN